MEIKSLQQTWKSIPCSRDYFDAWWCGCGCDGHIGASGSPDYIEALMPVSNSTICCDGTTACSASSVISKSPYTFKSLKMDIIFAGGNNAIGKNTSWGGNSIQLMLAHDIINWCGPEMGVILDLNNNPIKFMAYADGNNTKATYSYWQDVYLPVTPDRNQHNLEITIDDNIASRVHFIWDGTEVCWLDPSANQSNCTDGYWCQCNTPCSGKGGTTVGGCPCPDPAIDYNQSYYVFIGTQRQGSWDGTNYYIRAQNINYTTEPTAPTITNTITNILFQKTCLTKTLCIPNWMLGLGAIGTFYYLTKSK